MYDYGQLNSKTEADYIVQIVKNNVRWATSFKAISSVNTACASF